ncbi:hypothetical protein [Motiliproteus sp. SC1-56]|uniref:hypothetical protein n=1 Tax=Motiliproteus sp. SC1-56 TaxID=2799565 RepID=UPI001A8DBFA8|nr:hypothetical protein [Motiliproteus sp. SC1-56]
MAVSEPIAAEPAARRLASPARAAKGELADCYAEVAEQLEHCNNSPAADTFQLLARRLRSHLHNLGPAPADDDAAPLPESPADEIFLRSHYLMTPYHAVELALTMEQQTHHALLNHLNLDEAALRRTPVGHDYLAEQTRHFEGLRSLLAQMPAPPAGWDEDPDPPRMDE